MVSGLKGQISPQKRLQILLVFYLESINNPSVAGNFLLSFHLVSPVKKE